MGLLLPNPSCVSIGYDGGSVVGDAVNTLALKISLYLHPSVIWLRLSFGVVVQNLLSFVRLVCSLLYKGKSHVNGSTHFCILSHPPPLSGPAHLWHVAPGMLFMRECGPQDEK